MNAAFRYVDNGISVGSVGTFSVGVPKWRDCSDDVRTWKRSFHECIDKNSNFQGERKALQNETSKVLPCFRGMRIFCSSLYRANICGGKKLRRWLKGEVREKYG